MKIEVVIPHRREVPRNLHKTYYGLRSHGIPVRLVDDSMGMGTGYSRNKGILESKADIVFTCDAHMRFDPGYFDHLVSHIESNPQDVTCSRMQCMNEGWQDIPGQVYAGAEIMAKDEIPGGQHISLAGKWRRKDTGNGPIGCVMGACYGFARGWYEAIGRPMALSRAWGCDEELLSIPSWLCGGRVYLIDGMAHHIYAAPRVGGRGIGRDEAARVWANRLAMLSAIPMLNETRIDLVNWLCKTPALQQVKVEVNAHLENMQEDANRLFFAVEERQQMSFEEYMLVWGRHEEKSRAEIERDAARVSDDEKRVQPDQITCRECGLVYMVADAIHVARYPEKTRYSCPRCQMPTFFP